MKIIKVIQKKVTVKEKTIIFTFVKCDDNKLYEAIRTKFGDYILKELKQ